MNSDKKEYKLIIEATIWNKFRQTFPLEGCIDMIVLQDQKQIERYTTCYHRCKARLQAHLKEWDDADDKNECFNKFQMYQEDYQ